MCVAKRLRDSLGGCPHRRGTGGDDTRRVTTAEASSVSRVKSRRATCTLFCNRQVCFFASVRFSSVLFLFLFLFFGYYSCLYLSRVDDRSAAAGLELPPPPQLMMAEVRGRKPRHGVFRNFLFLFLFLLSLLPINSIYYQYIIYPIHRSEIPGTEHAKRNIILIKNDYLKTVHLFFWQLFMVPGLREEILSVRIPRRKLEDFPRELVGRRVSLPQDEAAVQVLQQVQRTFLHLRDGKRRSFDPVRLVDACSCLNLNHPVNEQNDASEFCDKLLDRVESGHEGGPARD